MSIRPISVKTQKYDLTKSKPSQGQNVRNTSSSNPAFTGKLGKLSIPKGIIWMMDGIAAGGFALSFVTQDFLGMGVPRTWHALYRNKNKKNDKYNWGYARLVGIREALSGPSSFIIPSLMLLGIKKYGGSANNVKVDYIKGFSDNFADYVAKHKDTVKDEKALKKGFYTETFKNILKSSLDNLPKGKDGLIDENSKKLINEKAEKYASKLIEAETAPKHFVWNKWIDKKKNFGKFLKKNISDDFQHLKKQYSSEMPASFSSCTYTTKNESLIPTDKRFGIQNADKTKVLHNDISKFMHSMTDYTNDAVNSVCKHFENSKKSISEYMDNFAHKRIGTRFACNILMTSAVILFYTIIPKLYNEKDGKNPALDGLGVKQNAQNKEQGKEVQTNA